MPCSYSLSITASNWPHSFTYYVDIADSVLDMLIDASYQFYHCGIQYIANLFAHAYSN